MCFPTSGKEAQPGVNRSDEIGQRKRGNRTQDDLLDSKGVRKKAKKNRARWRICEEQLVAMIQRRLERGSQGQRKK